MTTIKQPRSGQCYNLKVSDNTDPRTTHVAIQTRDKFMYFCRFDPTDIHPQDGVPDDEVKGTYWITPCAKYGSCYNGASLWQGGFDFVSLEEWREKGMA